LEFGKRKNGHRAVLCLLLGRFDDVFEGNTAPLDKKESIGLRITATSTVFSRFRPRDFFLFPNMKKMAWRKHYRN
jgi:hypothetical protein